MERVAVDINRHVSQSKFKSAFADIINKGGQGLRNSQRVMIHENIARCESARKNIAIFIFNDLFVHMTESKAKNRALCADPRYQWPMELVWIQQKKSYTKIIGPSGYYKFRTSEISEWKYQLEKAISDHLATIDSSEPLTLESETREGSYLFQESNTSFSGIWKIGKVSFLLLKNDVN